MKKILAGLAIFSIFSGVLVGSLILGINVSGGLPSSQKHLAELPLVGDLVRVNDPPDAEPAPVKESNTADKPASPTKEAPSLLDLAPKKRLEKLCREVERKAENLEEQQRALDRQTVELETWEEELTRTREEVLKKLQAEKQRLTQVREEVDAARKDLEERRVEMEETKRDNLEKTASIFGRMDAQRGARILAKMYESGEEETVVTILYLMRDRNAANILNAFTDVEVGAKLTQRLSYVQEQKEARDR